MQPETRENFRKVADQLAHHHRMHGTPSVLFTAAEPGSGTTTAAIGVASELQSLAGLRTLLVDFNLRRPAVAQKLGLKPAKSLADVAAGTCSLADAVTTTDSGLAVLAAPPANTLQPSIALVQQVMEAANGRYDFVLFDTPPILGYADTMVAAGPVPRVVLVVAAGKTPYEVLDRIRRELEARSITLLGSVLNRHRRFIPNWIYRFFAR